MLISRPLRPFVYLALVALLVAGIAFAAEPTVITQEHRSFDPTEVTVAAGSSLRFANQDEFIHHIYVKSDSFNYDSDELPPGQSIDVKFPTAGTFEVGCRIHPKMHLTVTVQ